MPEVTYNERSWAIDLIGYIKGHISSRNQSIKDASGEQTVRTDGGSLFPDVLLFGDRSTTRILQGWELKMPDTSIDDHEFKMNAETKARNLGLDSFILWNVRFAKLYVRNADTDKYVVSKKWDDLAAITERTGVLPNRHAWEDLAAKIIDYVNDLFDRGTLEGRRFIEAYESGGITSLIMENSGVAAAALKAAAARSAVLNAEITVWWLTYQSEYGKSNDKFDVLAQANISNWIGKFLFAHILQGRDSRAQAVREITEDTSPDEALAIFKNLSETCNFWTIFSDSVGLSLVSNEAWQQMLQFNRLLSDLRIGQIDQQQLSNILEATVEVTRRKLRGQYPTPPALAQLLVRLCLQNQIDDRFIDPCCGSGTISRAALEIKLAANVPPADVAASVYASDQDSQALQISTFSMAKPALMNMPIKIFRHDAFKIEPATEIEFRDPTNGTVSTEQLGKFDAISSNLPFVAQAGRNQYGNAIADVNQFIGEDIGALPGKSDVAAYLPFAFYPLLNEDGRLGIIITNAWLGTDWGDAFFEKLTYFYKLKSVVTSGAGRWFQNAEVVTNLLIFEKLAPDAKIQKSEVIDFIVLLRPLPELEDANASEEAAAQIELGQSHGDTMSVRSVTHDDLARFRVLGLAGNAQFVNCDWVLDLPLVPVKSNFDISRGMRRGWNELFYPEDGHGIESEYIEAVMRSPTEIERLVSSPRSNAFCCSKTIDELKSLGHTGALNWIARFENAANSDGKPLTEVLASNQQHWYEMSASSMAEIVMSLGFGDRLFISKLEEPAFVDQRLIRLNSKDDIDLDLCHALLNSAIGMFMIEGIGFGRGAGVLDLNKDRMQKFMHMLDPEQIDAEAATTIKEAFLPLLDREIYDIADELEMADRQSFDQAVLDVFSIKVPLNTVYESLLSLFSVRETVKLDI